MKRGLAKFSDPFFTDVPSLAETYVGDSLDAYQSVIADLDISQLQLEAFIGAIDVLSDSTWSLWQRNSSNNAWFFATLRPNAILPVDGIC